MSSSTVYLLGRGSKPGRAAFLDPSTSRRPGQVWHPACPAATQLWWKSGQGVHVLTQWTTASDITPGAQLPWHQCNPLSGSAGGRQGPAFVEVGRLKTLLRQALVAPSGSPVLGCLTGVQGMPSALSTSAGTASSGTAARQVALLAGLRICCLSPSVCRAFAPWLMPA